MSKKAQPRWARTGKKIRKAVRNNPLIAASIVALSGLATAAAGSKGLRARTLRWTGSVAEKLRLRKATNGVEAVAELVSGKEEGGRQEDRAAP